MRRPARSLPPLLMLLIAAALQTGCSSDSSEGEAAAPPPPPTVEVAKPVVREVVEDDEYVGRFAAIDEVDVRARVGGYLEEVHFVEGSIVEAGDLLFTIDQRPFATALTQARAALRTAETRLEFARGQFFRAEDLVARGTMSVALRDERRQEYLSAEAEAESAEAAVTRAQLDMEYTEIRAPMTGRIGGKRVSVGNLVLANDTVLTSIVSLDPIHFLFDIDERAYLAYAGDALSQGLTIQEGAGSLPVKVRVGDYRVTQVEGELDFAENRLDEATGTLRVRARFANPDYLLQPGLFGRVNVPGSLPYQGVLVPDEAIAADQDRRIVYVVDEAGQVSAKPVRPGPRLHGYRVIREGMTGEETIIINGLMRVRPGITVTPELIELPPERS